MDDDLDLSGERTSVACGAVLLFPLGEPFTGAGRGGAAYLTAYGRPPSHTLRRRV